MDVILDMPVFKKFTWVKKILGRASYVSVSVFVWPGQLFTACLLLQVITADVFLTISNAKIYKMI